MTLMSLLLLAALLPDLSHSASVNVGIVNGTEVKPHSRPYMVSIQANGQHMCGGFLVSEQFVMTAAHCMSQQQLTVVLGAHDLLSNREGSFRLNVECYHPHPHFKRQDYDIMLLKLSESVRKTKTVNWITIPQRDKDIPANTVCSVAGWGQTGAHKPLSNRLLETRTKIIDRKRCANMWPITQRMVCAHHPGGSCQGDSGGPLVCNNVASGIVSFGEKMCDSTERPNVYAKISAFLPWIKSIIGKV